MKLSELSEKVSTKHKAKMVGLNGLEPSTSPLSGVCSNQLSYKPIVLCQITMDH